MFKEMCYIDKRAVSEQLFPLAARLGSHEGVQFQAGMHKPPNKKTKQKNKTTQSTFIFKEDLAGPFNRPPPPQLSTGR